MTLSLTSEALSGGRVRITVSGELLATDAAPLREALHRLLQTAVSVVFDLTGLRSWSVGCQAALVDAARSVRLAGGGVVVHGLAGVADRQAFDTGLHASLFGSPAAVTRVVDLSAHKPAVHLDAEEPAAAGGRPAD